MKNVNITSTTEINLYFCKCKDLYLLCTYHDVQKNCICTYFEGEQYKITLFSDDSWHTCNFTAQTDKTTGFHKQLDVILVNQSSASIVLKCHISIHKRHFLFNQMSYASEKINSNYKILHLSIDCNHATQSLQL